MLGLKLNHVSKRGHNRQHRAKNQVCLTRFTTITIHLHLGMHMPPSSPISVNVITNLPKCTLNKIVHIIHRKPIKPANQPAFRPQKQIECESSPKRYLIPGCNNHFYKSVFALSKASQGHRTSFAPIQTYQNVKIDIHLIMTYTCGKLVWRLVLSGHCCPAPNVAYTYLVWNLSCMGYCFCTYSCLFVKQIERITMDPMSELHTKPRIISGTTPSLATDSPRGVWMNRLPRSCKLVHF